MHAFYIPISFRISFCILRYSIIIHVSYSLSQAVLLITIITILVLFTL